MLRVIILVGLPGCGKSTYAEKLKNKMQNSVLLSSDSMRAEFGKDESDQTVNQIVFKTLKERLENNLKNNKDVIIDATNISKKDRKDYIDISNKYNVCKAAIVWEYNKEFLLKRNIDRGNAGGRNVPEYVIDRMLLKYERPTEAEGFNLIIGKHSTYPIIKDI